MVGSEQAKLYMVHNYNDKSCDRVLESVEPVKRIREIWERNSE
jgi:hypothetical protein